MNTFRQTGRWIVGVTSVAALLLPVAAARADEKQMRQAAVDEAMEKVLDELSQADLPEEVKHIAVIGLQNDEDGYATSKLEIVAKQADKFRLFTRKDEDWQRLIAEIEWGTVREGTITPESAQTFREIGVDAILCGKVWNVHDNMQGTRSFVKLVANLQTVASGEIIWTSDMVEGEAFIHWSDAATRFWRYPVVLIGVLLVLVIVWFLIARMRRMFRPL